MIATANKERAETLCGDDDLSVSRQRRADKEVYLNKTLLTNAIRHSLSELQQVTSCARLYNATVNPFLCGNTRPQKELILSS